MKTLRHLKTIVPILTQRRLYDNLHSMDTTKEIWDKTTLYMSIPGEKDTKRPEQFGRNAHSSQRIVTEMAEYSRQTRRDLTIKDVASYVRN